MALNFNDLLKQKNRHWLEVEIEQFLNVDRSVREPDGYFHPSGISSKHALGCDRYAQFLLWKKTPPVQNAKTMRIFANGSAMHERYQHLFQEMGILVEAERAVQNDQYHIKGTMDGLIKIPYSEKLVILELKSANTSTFDSITKAMYAHEVQLRIYMGLERVNSGLVFYENKNNQEIKIFDYQHDEEWWQATGSRLMEIWNLWNQRIQAEQTKNEELCNGCTFYQHCKGKFGEKGKSFTE
jgi:CRISPR/Cas system-associated exonuclease Cas4 (RecB family)